MSANAAWKGTGFDAYQNRASRFVSMAVAGAVLVGMVVAKAGGAGTAAAPSAPVPGLNTPVAASVLQNLKTAARLTLGYTGGANPASIAARVGHATGPVAGGPTLLYVGAEYCPYCAAQRWALVLTLLRFGQLSGLRYMASSSSDLYPSTPTFTFVKASYRSPYLHFQAVEGWGRTLDSAGTYPTLQIPTAAQRKTFETLNAPPYVPASAAGDIPFVDVAGRYVWVGAPFFPTQLHPGGWATVAAGLASLGTTGASSSTDDQAIARAANVFTAAICSADGNAPASVCAAPGVLAAKGALPK